MNAAMQNRSDGDQHGGQTDQRVHHRDRFRHLRHRYRAGTEDTDGGTDNHCADNQCDIGVGDEERRDDSQRHTDHAVAITHDGGRRRGQATQRHDEKDGADEIGPIRVLCEIFH